MPERESAADLPPDLSWRNDVGGLKRRGTTGTGLSHPPSWLWTDLSYGSVWLERETSTGAWERVQEWPMQSPIYELRHEARLRSNIIEANEGTSSGYVPPFRFVLDELPPELFRVYEPVFYCRLGGLA